MSYNSKVNPTFTMGDGMADSTKEELINDCRYVAQKIERFRDNDLLYCAEEDVFYHRDRTDYPDEAEYDGKDDGIAGYIDQVYDIRLIIDLDGSLYGCILQVAGGGPDIRIDTYKGEVRGHWGLDECHIPISAEICKIIDDEIEERRGNY